MLFLDLGMQYIALEEDGTIYDTAARRIIHKLRSEMRKRPKLDEEGSSVSCGVGKKHCKYPGLPGPIRASVGAVQKDTQFM